MNITATKKSFLLFLFVFISLIVNLVTNTPVSAYTFKRTISTSVEVISTSQVKVTQTHKLTWDNPTYFFPAPKNFLYAYIFPAYTEQVPGIETKVKDLSVTSRYVSSKNLNYTKSIVDGALQVKIPYYENLDYNNTLEYVVSYSTNLYVLMKGGILEISYPGLSKDFNPKINHKSEGYDEITTYSLNFVVPTSLGEITSIFPDPISNKQVGGMARFSYDASNITGNSVQVTIGKRRFIKFVLSGKTYATNANAPDFVQDLLTNYIEVALPSSNAGTESSNQTVYFSKIEPYPIELKTDSDGNTIAKIPVSAVKDGVITIEGYAIVSNNPMLESTKLAKKSEIPSTMASYLGAESRYWQVNDANIQDKAHSVIAKDDTIYGQLRKTLTYVSQNLTYAKFQDESSLVRLGAVGALEKKVGVCMEYSDTLLTLLRAQGIPTRTVFGDGVGAHIDKTLQGIGHQWVGVWFPGEGWVSVDPTWSDNNKEYIGQDFDHFVWYVASKSVNEPSGFNCLSWDSQSPCKEALSIETSPVDEIGNVESLMTLQLIKEQLGSNQVKTNIVSRTLQDIVSFLGESQIGRILLSKQGMFVLFAISLYSLLVMIVSVIIKKVKNARSQVAR